MSDEVSNFLRSVEQLKERRDQEDEARSRELEEKFLQERRERQARRAERARSISPQKSSPANTPPPTSQRISGANVADGTKLDASPVLDRLGSPSSRAARPTDVTDTATDYSISPTKENDPIFDPDTKRSSVTTLTSPSTAGPAVRSPLSWQRRPTSQTSERPKSRPLSMVATENATARSSVATEQTPSEQEPSRDQIAQALAGKDPSFFRQTADRGLNSPAYRRTQVEDQDVVDLASSRVQLPGMTRGPSTSPPKETPGHLSSPPQLHAKLGSPLVLTGAQRLDPPSAEAGDDENTVSADRQQSVPSPGGRTSPTRPLSPTKGLGGFVQSAMMKRSDSVKRWSVTSPTGLQRADSTVSNRTSLEHNQPPSPTKRNSRPTSLLREGSKTPSRPSSSHDEEPQKMEPKEEEDKTTPPTSPSRTMDPRRWSPTKSSWLESALNKPEAPKPKPTPPPSNQPAWMVELSKARAQKANSGSVDLGRGSPLPRKHEVKTGGLMRSSPMGSNVKPSGLGGLGGSLSPVIPTGDKTPVAALRNNLTRRASEAGTDDGEGGSGSDQSKPATPSRQDFRAGLKSRPPPPASEATGDELKNVFGNLRRTKTQNYVAPDELKNNILRGKAALNLTGGPKKTERKDEFKEAILKKKDEFKKAQQEGRGVTKGPSTPTEKAIPEGIARKLEMKRSSTVSDKRDSTISEAPSEYLSRTAESNRSSTTSTFSNRESADVTPLSTPKPSIASEKETTAPPTPTLQKETSAPARIQTRTAGSSLADRFNPALAGILARGPPGAGSGPSKSPGASSAQATSSGGGDDSSEPPKPGPQLTHMTRNRARGPARKAPSTAPKAAVSTESVRQETPAKAPSPVVEKTPVAAAERTPSPVVEKAPVAVVEKTPSPVVEKAPAPTVEEEEEKRDREPIMSKPKSPMRSEPPAPAPKPDVVPLVNSSKQASSEPKPPSDVQVISLVDSSKKRPVVEELKLTGQPISFPDSPSYKSRPRSPTKVHEQVAALAAKSQSASNAGGERDGPGSQPPSPSKLGAKRMSRFLDEAGSNGEQRGQSSSPTRSKPLPDLVPGKDDKVDSDPVVSVKNAKTLFGGPALGHTDADAPSSETGRPRSPTKRWSRPLPVLPKSDVTSPPVVSPPRSPTKSVREVSTTLSDFFGPDRPKRTYNVDAAEILARRPTVAPKIQTVKAQLYQVSGDGKRVPVPAHYDRVLFEREMYLCPHTFVNGSGRRVTEVYFWVGDEVPAPIVDDAHIFVQREAKTFGGKLVKVTQGKETPEFLQALGGVVTVRRGSSNKYDSLAPNMLCGRRYLGEIVFDEVDFTPASLCSGFPYLITQQGQCYLWKGKGSDVAELSCARLIGMELALMGELSEVEDGNEPPKFWDIFDGGIKSSSADHWRLKPNYDKYCGRLFKSDAADRKQIVELSPFSQADLLPTGIYILDAFFEMYVIVGAKAQSQGASFRNALEFAQEYAILASGVEDRPFIPVSTVVLEGIPRDLKSVFRKWGQAASPTATVTSNPASPGLARGRSLRIVPLTQALQAMSE